MDSSYPALATFSSCSPANVWIDSVRRAETWQLCMRLTIMQEQILDYVLDSYPPLFL